MDRVSAGSTIRRIEGVAGKDLATFEEEVTTESFGELSFIRKPP